LRVIFRAECPPAQQREAEGLEMRRRYRIERVEDYVRGSSRSVSVYMALVRLTVQRKTRSVIQKHISASGIHASTGRRPGGVGIH
jgi:hypothetical protein